MKVVKTVAEATAASLAAKRSGSVIGLVPTMGALHDGHRSLVRRARDECDFVAVSIFVNPTQFGEGEDLDSYPRTLERDLMLCDEDGADLVLAPTNEGIYLPGHTSWVEVGGLTQKLEGMTRPSHFRGVTTIVAKLFNVFLPDLAYFGQKDLQQCAVVGRMARDLNFPVKIVRCPIVREDDGLAMSSRNAYLSPEERKAALCLHEALGHFEEEVAGGERDANRLIEAMAEIIIAEPLAALDYAAIIDPDTLEDVQEVRGQAAAALAAWVGETRLIDNAIVTADG
ncbi:MAG: pantoate--beta-alanine ligase [Planctomycetota bacterium]